ncbi:MAG: hypothetical protein DSZ23_01130 [Thermodesulfatator sp.]|nr:MAG: hypothetical protein DSZ23_01130 [Thermodesulfatator sp.]
MFKNSGVFVKFVIVLLLSLFSTSVEKAPVHAAAIYMTVMDCVGNITSGDVVQSYLGDGYCDDGTWGINLNCSTFNYDNGDCSSGNTGGGYTTDCVGNVASVAQIQQWLGDGYCDDGTYGLVLYCSAYNWDYGDCSGGGSGNGAYTTDCVGNTVSVAQVQQWLGDGYCDDGTYGMVLYCAQYNWDYGDCSGGAGGGSGNSYVIDCSGNAVPLSYVQAWLGDGYCDYGQSNINLNCAEFNYDGGDCILY